MESQSNRPLGDLTISVSNNGNFEGTVSYNRILLRKLLKAAVNERTEAKLGRDR